MDQAFATTTQHFKPQPLTPKVPNNFIAIRSLSYQKAITDAKLKDDFFRTTHEGFSFKPSLQQFIHKINKNRNNLMSTSDTTTKLAAFKPINSLKNENRFRNKTSFNFDSINYNKMIRKSNEPAFFTKFMTGKSPSALLHPPFEVPDDKKIQEDYRFKLPVIISSMENENIYINVLMAFPHSTDFIEGWIEDTQKGCRQLEAQKQELKKGLEGMQKRFEDDLDQQTEFFRKEFERIGLKEDFVKNQNENFRLQKEITLLLRDKTNLETDIESSLEKIKKIELDLYKVEMYDLEINEEYIKTLNMQNLRMEHSGFLQGTHIFH